MAWADTDAAQIAWVGSFLKYTDDAEAALFSAVGRPLPQIFERDQILMPRTQFTCAFRSPARFYDVLDVALGIEQMTERRIVWRFEMREQESTRLVAEGSYEIACVDRATFKGRPFPSEVIALLAAQFGVVVSAAPPRDAPPS